MTQRLLLNVNEVASLLGCGRTYVYGMIQRGELPVVKLGRLTRVPSRALTEFIANEENAAPTSLSGAHLLTRRGPR